MDILDFLRQNANDFRGLLPADSALHEAAIALDRMGERLPREEFLIQMQSNLDAVLPHIKDPQVATRFLLIAVSIHSFIDGRRAAVEYAIRQMGNPELTLPSPEHCGMVLSHFGWFEGLTAQDLAAMAQPLSPAHAENDKVSAYFASRILGALNMKASTNIEWLRIVVDGIAVPWMLAALERDFVNCALYIENMLYQGWLQRVEILEHYKQSYARWVKPMYAAGQRLRGKLPPVKPAKKDRPVVGIFVHSASWLAHIALLHHTLGALDERPYDIKIYVADARYDVMEQRFADIGIECVFLHDAWQGERWAYADMFEYLRGRAAADGVEVMIWLCMATLMHFAYGLGLAPRQVYWSMRIMINTLMAADEWWMAFNDPKDEIEFQGRVWKVTPVTMKPSKVPAQSEVDALRAQYAGKTILGTLVRADKLMFEGFLNTICDILDRHRDTVYLYTGRGDLPELRAAFEKRGVSDRAIFIGWVNTALYARVFDVYLDCWPARSGVTLFNALEAKIPIMIFMGDHSDHYLSRLSYFFFRLWERDDGYHLEDEILDASYTLPDGSRALLAFNTRDEYMAALDRLIEDPAYRKACGEAGRAMYEYLTGTKDTRRKVGTLIENALKAAREALHEAA